MPLSQDIAVTQLTRPSPHLPEDNTLQAVHAKSESITDVTSCKSITSHLRPDSHWLHWLDQSGSLSQLPYKLTMIHYTLASRQMLLR